MIDAIMRTFNHLYMQINNAGVLADLENEFGRGCNPVRAKKEKEIPNDDRSSDEVLMAIIDELETAEVKP